jgi:ubiquinone/menaquinone biosynthesis C-methylase UbiE
LPELGRAGEGDYHWVSEDDYSDMLKEVGFKDIVHAGYAPLNSWGPEEQWNRFNSDRTNKAVSSGDKQMISEIEKNKNLFLKKAYLLIEEYIQKYGREYLGIKNKENGTLVIEYLYPIVVAKKKSQQEYRPGTFDSRIVQYEKIHQITDEQINALIKAVDLGSNQKVLDGCAGYGSITKWLLEMYPKEITETCTFFVQDDSSVQIERAKNNLKDYDGIKFSIENITHLPYENDIFDRVIIKMGLHENPKSIQAEIVKEVLRVLKPGGKFVIWELFLNEKTQPIFQGFMHKKDELAGFNALVKNRYFPRGDEIENYLRINGFKDFKKEFTFNPVLSTKVRFDELISKELKESGKTEPDEALRTIAQTRLNELNNFFRELPDEQKEIINFEDKGDAIIIYNIDKAIVSAVKPL